MTSVFQVLAHEDANDQTKRRQAMALSMERVEDRFGLFVRHGSVDEQAARFSLIEDDLKAVVANACGQVGYLDVDGAIYNHIAKNFVRETPQLKTAGMIHEARKPKMCPYHSEVTDISLAAGESQAGFNAMAQHAWGPKHCQGEGYEGDRCKFKPAMTTQAYWEERTERLEQKREERAERERQETLQAEQQVTELQAVPDNADVPQTTEPVDIVEQTVEEAPSEAIPMAMAAKVAATCPTCHGGGHDPEKVSDKPCPTCGGSGEVADKEASVKTAETATPVPKMDKRKWTPKTVGPIDTEGDDSPHPTKRKDITEPIKSEQGEHWNPSELKEIGEQVTEHQDVTEKGGVTPGDQGGTFGGGERSAVSSLLSEDAVRDALSKYKRV